MHACYEFTQVIVRFAPNPNAPRHRLQETLLWILVKDGCGPWQSRPCIYIAITHGKRERVTRSKEKRAKIIVSRQDFEVCITSYEIWEIGVQALSHKNIDLLLGQIVRAFISHDWLLITGTPLQNNLEELFALLNFICPRSFSIMLIWIVSCRRRQVQRKKKKKKGKRKKRKVVEALHGRCRWSRAKNLLPSMLIFLCDWCWRWTELFFALEEINIHVELMEMQRSGTSPFWRRISTPSTVGRLLWCGQRPLISGK